MQRSSIKPAHTGHSRLSQQSGTSTSPLNFIRKVQSPSNRLLLLPHLPYSGRGYQCRTGSVRSTHMVRIRYQTKAWTTARLPCGLVKQCKQVGFCTPKSDLENEAASDCMCTIAFEWGLRSPSCNCFDLVAGAFVDPTVYDAQLQLAKHQNNLEAALKYHN